MKRVLSKRRLLIAAGVVCAILLVAIAGALYTLQTSWFRQQVRNGILSSAEKATGGKVDIRDFDYDWRSFTARFTHFIIHGTEPASAPPLFEAASVRVRLRLLSLLRRDVEIALLQVDRPQVHIAIARDGATNLPFTRFHTSFSGFVQQLFALRVQRFEFQHAFLQIDAQNPSLSARANDLNIFLTYERRKPGYSVVVGSRQIQLAGRYLRPLSGAFSASAHFDRDRLLINDLVLASGNSQLNVHDTSLEFTHPAVDFYLSARTAAPEIASTLNVAGIRTGVLNAKGTLHYDEAGGFAFSGTLGGQDLGYTSRQFALNRANFTSHIGATRNQLAFSDLNASILGGTLRGSGSVKLGGDFQFTGNFAGWQIRQLIALQRVQKFPWNGLASGNLILSGTLGRRNLTARSSARIAPLRSSAPLSGEIDIAYKQPGETLEFGNSHLNLAHTQVAFSGTAEKSIDVHLNTTDLRDLDPALASFNTPQISIPNNGNLHFDGTISGPLANPVISGDVAGAQFEYENELWRQAQARIRLDTQTLEFSNFAADSNLLHIAGNGQLGLENWILSPSGAIRLNVQFQHADLGRISSLIGWKLPIEPGIASGTLNLSGSASDPRGSGRVHIENLDAYGQRLSTMQMDVALEPSAIEITKGSVNAGPAVLTFSGNYHRDSGTWKQGQFSIKADTNRFPLAALEPVHRVEPQVTGQLEGHVRAAFKITPDHFVPSGATGNLTARDIAIGGVPYGSIAAKIATQNASLDATVSGTLRGARLNGKAQVQLGPGLPSNGELHLDRIGIPLLYALATANPKQPFPLDGSVAGGLTFSGPLEYPEQMRGAVRLDQLQLSSAVPAAGDLKPRETDLIFRNSGPILLDAANGIATVRAFELSGTDTTLSIRGKIPYLGQKALALTLRGSADLRILQLFDPNLRSAGQSTISTSITGTLASPALSGTLQLRKGSFSFGDLPMGLTAVNGSVNFDGDRATVQNLTAQSGGGEVSLAGFVTYGGGLPVYHLTANADNVRVRYAGASATATADLRLSGTSDNSILSGNITVSRVSFNPNADAGALLTSAAARSLAPANENDFLTGLQLDIHIQSSPDLQVSTALSRGIEGEIDLRLRGTPEHPILLGSAAINQGDIRVFGTKYTINRGEVSFANPAKIVPVFNLDLQTQTRGITVGITISGAIGKLNINYRSDPPLQPRDIIALLTVGRTPDLAASFGGSQTNTDVSTLQSNADTVLGAAVSPSSGRLQKLFGVANVRIDPMVQGITNTMQRLTIEQQISRDITVTYVTNLSQTSEQIFRFEWALSPQYSVVALRDDNGEFGLDFQYKKRFK